MKKKIIDRPVWWLQLVILLSICLITLVSWKVQTSIEERMRQAVGNSLQTVLVETEQTLNLWYENHEKVALVHANDEYVINATLGLLVQPGTRDALLMAQEKEDLSEELSPGMDIFNYQGYSIISKNSLILASSRDSVVGEKTPVPENILQQVFIKGETATSHPQQSEVLLPNRKGDLEMDEPTMFTLAPIRDEAGNIIAALCFRINPILDFSSIFKLGILGKTGKTYAFNVKGQLVSESRYEHELRAMGMVDNDQRTILNMHVRDPGGNLMKGHRSDIPLKQLPLTQMAQNATAGLERDGLSLKSYRDFMGVSVIGAWQWHKDRNLGITTEITEQEAYRSLYASRVMTLSILALTILVIIILDVVFLISRRRIVKSEELLSTAQRIAVDGLITINEHCNIESFNPAAEKLFGYTADEVKGENVKILMPGPHHENHDDYLKCFSATGLKRFIGKGQEVVGCRKDGRQFPMDLVVMEMPIGNKTYFSGVMRDISESKWVERRLREAKQKAEEANLAKSQFLANMSHELRTPLNAIIGYSELMEEDAIDQGLKAFIPDLKKVSSSGRHLLTLINNILDLSKIEAGKIDAEAESFNVEAMLEGVITTIQPMMDNNKNHFKKNLADGIDHIISDQLRLRQILINLLSNAAKFTHGGEVVLDVLLETSGDVEQIIFRISDSGIGMSPEQLKIVFNAFEQADLSTTRRYGGTGLGLAISQSFVELLGGQISVESELEQGTTFTVKLPVQFTPVYDQPIGSEYPGSIDKDLQLLVIEGDRSKRDFICQQLGSSNENYKVITAANSEEGVQMAKDFKPDLILLDLMMPEMDGFEFLKQLNMGTEKQDVPVIVVTAKDLTEEDHERLSAYAEDILHMNNFKGNELLNKVNRLLNRNRVSALTDDFPTDRFDS